MKLSERLMSKIQEMGLMDVGDWEYARIRRCRSGKHQLAEGWWSWEIDCLRGHTPHVIGSTSSMGECVRSKKLTVMRDGGFITVEPIEYN